MREHLWRTPPGAAMRPPVTDDAVRDAQRRLGVKLLTSYVELLKVRNGGYLRYDSHPAAVPTSWATDHVGVEHIMGIGPGPAGNILDTPWLVEEWGMPEGLVLLSGDGHTWIALDYRSCGPSGEPSVVWIDNELDEEVRLAPDFQTFLDGLVPGNHRHVFGLEIIGTCSASLVSGTALIVYWRSWGVSSIPRSQRARPIPVSLVRSPNGTAIWTATAISGCRPIGHSGGMSSTRSTPSAAGSWSATLVRTIQSALRPYSPSTFPTPLSSSTVHAGCSSVHNSHYWFLP